MSPLLALMRNQLEMTGALGLKAATINTTNRDALQALDGGNDCLVSQQTPSSGFTPAAAMSRNKLIYGLSEVTVVVSTDLESGGTWAGATEALNTHNGLVAVWRGEGEGPGNQELERRGAIPIKTAEDLGPLLDRPPPTPPEQLSLTE